MKRLLPALMHHQPSAAEHPALPVIMLQRKAFSDILRCQHSVASPKLPLLCRVRSEHHLVALATRSLRLVLKQPDQEQKLNEHRKARESKEESERSERKK